MCTTYIKTNCKPNVNTEICVYVVCNSILPKFFFAYLLSFFYALSQTKRKKLRKHKKINTNKYANKNGPQNKSKKKSTKSCKIRKNITDEGTNQESTQEQIFENIRLHKEVIQSVKLQPWPMRKKLKLVRQVSD